MHWIIEPLDSESDSDSDTILMVDSMHGMLYETRVDMILHSSSYRALLERIALLEPARFLRPQTQTERRGKWRRMKLSPSSMQLYWLHLLLSSSFWWGFLPRVLGERAWKGVWCVAPSRCGHNIYDISENKCQRPVESHMEGNRRKWKWKWDRRWQWKGWRVVWWWWGYEYLEAGVGSTSTKYKGLGALDLRLD